MTARTKSTLQTNINADLADNTSAAITPQKLRNIVTDITDSHLNSLDGYPSSAFASLPSAASVPWQIYRVTDCRNALFMSDGTLWEPLNGTALIASGIGGSVTGTTSNTDILTVTIPANIMGPNGQLEIVSMWSVTNNANNKTLRANFGGTDFLAAVVTTQISPQLYTNIANMNATNSQKGMGAATSIFFGLGTSAQVTSAVDTTASVNLTFRAQLGVGTDTATLEKYFVRLIKP